MERGIAGMAFLHTDLVTGIRAAGAAGYQAIELWASAVSAFLEGGSTIDDIKAQFDIGSVRPVSVVALDDIDLPDGPQRKGMLESCHDLCTIASELGCLNITMVSGVTFRGEPWSVIRRETARGLREVADIAADYGLIVNYEPLAWRPVSRASQAMEVIVEANRPNVGLLVDAFHAFAGGEDLDVIRSLDPECISTVHLGDAVERQGTEWSDDDRSAMTGEGIVPLAEIMGAILSTGYDGLISDEFCPNQVLDWSPADIARSLKVKGDAILSSLNVA